MINSFTISKIKIKISKVSNFSIDLKMKLKTRKSAAKRVKVKKNCFSRKKAYKGHLLRKKNSKRLRRLSEASTIHFSDFNAFSLMVPY
ncbi:MAG: Ribosomal protein [Bacteroidota bacterium]|jgi:large subunit ribosomal protein L35